MEKHKWSNILNHERIVNYERKHFTSDVRSEFENDYDRIISSAAFRRLQDKAQVFPLEKFDFVRTRLTHSLEVSSTAKSLGRSIGKLLIEKTKNYDEVFNEEMIDDMCSILACSGLIHDIGNPPFGHFGETAIREWFEDKLTENNDKSYTFSYGDYSFKLTEQEAKDFMNFEGNAHALRILCKLPFVIDNNGLNLTKGVIKSIIKYPVSSTEIDKSNIISKKLGYFASEGKLFEELFKDSSLIDVRNPLVYILEAADDISYILGDLEDAFNKKIISFEELRDKYSRFVKENEFEYKSKEDTALYYLNKNYVIAEEEYGYDEPGEYSIKSFINKQNKYLRDAVVLEFVNSYDAIMAGQYEGDLLTNSKANKVAEFLRGLAKEYIYNNKDVVTSEIVGFNMVTYMLDTFIPIVLDPETEPYKGYNGRVYSMISKNYIFACNNSLKAGECTPEYYKVQLVIDYISGMTDSYAVHIYKTLKGMQL